MAGPGDDGLDGSTCSWLHGRHCAPVAGLTQGAWAGRGLQADDARGGGGGGTVVPGGHAHAAVRYLAARGL